MEIGAKSPRAAIGGEMLPFEVRARPPPLTPEAFRVWTEKVAGELNGNAQTTMECMMKKQPEAVTRDQILSILSADEIESVGASQTAAKLALGDEFIDLNELAKGVQQADASHPKEDLLSRKATNEHTWQKVVTNLNARQAMRHSEPVLRKRP